ncbi:Cation channel sperm-associated protein 4 [Stylophora pistillata]|uniref:Cation channel sperm-associated protein 4 n=1 Tax=Stylophora pistillata TaxID=50429 RepID=A0A2B4SWM6_STYPI|nr:Cation channel sperm-associated protein 4 [Stylophora pistillata]
MSVLTLQYPCAFALNLTLSKENLLKNIKNSHSPACAKPPSKDPKDASSDQGDEMDTSRTKRRFALYESSVQDFLNYFNLEDRIVRVDTSAAQVQHVWDAMMEFFAAEMDFSANKVINTVVVFSFDEKTYQSIDTNRYPMKSVLLHELIKEPQASASCGNRTSYCLFKKILLFTVRLTGVTMTLEVENSTFPLSIGKPKPKFKQQPIIAKEDITSSAENEDKVTIGFSFEYDWLITRRDISGTNRVALLSKTKTITEYFGYINKVEMEDVLSALAKHLDESALQSRSFLVDVSGTSIDEEHISEQFTKPQILFVDVNVGQLDYFLHGLKRKTDRKKSIFRKKAQLYKSGVNQVRLLNKLTAGFSKNEGESSEETADKQEKTKMTDSLKSTVDKVRLHLKVASVVKDASAKGKEEEKRDKEFYAVFHAIQNEKEELLMSKEDEEENMWDIVDLDDEAIEEYASNELLGQFLSNTVFRTGILCVILFNSLLIVVETDQEFEEKYSHLFSVLDQCLMTIFVCEILVKWYHGFFMFWKMGWNVLDFCIVVALLLGPSSVPCLGYRLLYRQYYSQFPDVGETYYIGGGLFLLVFIAIGAFVFANLVVAVVVTNLEFAMVDVKTEGKDRGTDDLKAKLDEDDTTLKTVGVEEVPSFVYLKQMPFQLPDLTQISAEKLENYFLILSAIEENLGESNKIKAEINEILCEVSELQEKAKKEGILKNDNEPDVTKNRSDDNFVVWNLHSSGEHLKSEGNR